MKMRKMGTTGLEIGPLVFGGNVFGWTADEQMSFKLLDAFVDAGLNFIDTADVYSKWVEGNPGGVAETYLGRWRKQANVPRDRLVIATKVRGRMGDGPNDEGLSRVHIMQAVEASLRRLDTDYIDLYQTHYSDKETPIEETMRAMDDLVRQGKVRYIGASNYKAWELMQALWASDKNNLVRYDSLQPHYNLIERAEFEAELRDVCKIYGLGVIPYSPLAGGFLTGKYRKDKPLPDSRRAKGLQHAMTEKNFALIEKMDEIGKGHNATVSQVALAWLLVDPIITSPIIGATTLEQLDENLGSLAVKLTDEERKILNDLTEWKSE